MKNERICIVKVVSDDHRNMVEVRFVHTQREYRAREKDYVRYYPLSTFPSMFNAQAQTLWIVNGNVPDGAVVC